MNNKLNIVIIIIMIITNNNKIIGHGDMKTSNSKCYKIIQCVIAINLSSYFMCSDQLVLISFSCWRYNN